MLQPTGHEIWLFKLQCLSRVGRRLSFSFNHRSGERHVDAHGDGFLRLRRDADASGMMEGMDAFTRQAFETVAGRGEKKTDSVAFLTFIQPAGR